MGWTGRCCSRDGEECWECGREETEHSAGWTGRWVWWVRLWEVGERLSEMRGEQDKDSSA